MNDAFTQQIEREFGSVDRITLPRLGERPLVAPANEAELCEVLRFAQAERKRVLPTGFASKLEWLPKLDDVDFALSTRRLDEVVAYEPGDGTLTALAGSRLADLERTVAQGRHHLTPQVSGAENATLGGVLAAGQSGWDRAARGTPSHHILGMRVALADGRVVSSGGRLVKNVTGFDMHRVYAGSRGSLCVILEASLRLFPAHQLSFSIRQSCESLDQALELAQVIDRSGLSPLANSIAFDPAESASLAVVVAGRSESAEWQRHKVLALLPGAELLEGEESRAQEGSLRETDLDGGAWAAVRISCVRSRLARALEATRSKLPKARLHVRPAVAEILVRASDDHENRVLVELATDLIQLGARPEIRRLDCSPTTPPTQSESASLRLMEKIRVELDPDSIFAGSATGRGKSADSV